MLKLDQLNLIKRFGKKIALSLKISLNHPRVLIKNQNYPKSSGVKKSQNILRFSGLSKYTEFPNYVATLFSIFQ